MSIRSRSVSRTRTLLAALLTAFAASAATPETPKTAPATGDGEPRPTAADGSSTQSRAAVLRTTTGEQRAANRETVASQTRIEAIDDETQSLLSQYRQAISETESHEAYGKELDAAIESQLEEMAWIDQQMSEADVVARDVLPMMTRMIETLDQFVALDLPFLLEERAKRVAGLRDIMRRADVTLSEKYRRILEAYQIEMEFGRTVEAYEGTLGEGGSQRALQFLRVGRVALLYQTPDEAETGYWDTDQKRWIVDNEYRYAFKEAVAVATKLIAPDLLFIPSPAPKEKQS